MSWRCLNQQKQVQFVVSCGLLLFALLVLAPPGLAFVTNPYSGGGLIHQPGWLTPLALLSSSLGIILRKSSDFNRRVLRASYRRFVASPIVLAATLGVYVAGLIWVAMRV